MPIVIDIN